MAIRILTYKVEYLMRKVVNIRLFQFICYLFICIPFFGQRADSIPSKPRFSPGKLDMLTRYSKASTDLNLIYWTPFIKAGGGIIFRENGNSNYGGFFIRPTQFLPTSHEFIFGANYISNNSKTDFDLQAEFRHKSGFCAGGGYIKSSFFESPAGAPRDNNYFAKASYRNKIKSWKYILTGLWQEFGKKETSGGFSKKQFPGGYAAFYSNTLGFNAGYEGESWRVSVNYVQQEKQGRRIRSAVEALYIDKTTGNNTGPKILWVNGTLKFSGGFLSKDGWLGRSMGATGLEFGNPLSYIVPINDGSSLFPGSPAIWNRALNTWELGGMVDFRLFHLDLPNKAKWGMADLVIYPLQFDKKESVVENIFVGTSFFYNTNLPSNQADITNIIPMIGYRYKYKKLNTCLQGQYNTTTEDISATLGIIYML